MQSLENRDFENKWRDAFADAEDEPNEALWLSIENSLAATDGIVMRGRVVFYQRLAAASLLFAFLLGGLSVIKWNSTTQQFPLANSQPKNNQKPDTKNQPADGNQANTSGTNKNEKAYNSTTQKAKPQNLLANKQYNNKAQVTSVQIIESQSDDKAQTRQHLLNQENREKYGDREVTLTNTFAYYAIKLKGKPVFDHRTNNRLILSEPTIPEKDKKREDDNWWAAIGGSAGVYSQQTTLNGGTFGNLNSPTTASRSQNATSSSAGSSFSVGMAMGKKISKRWVIMTGVNYLTQSVGYSSNQSFNGTQAYLAEFSNQKSGLNSATSFTSSYNVNSINEFVSIPLQAGYQLVQRKFGLQVNTGVASDIFLRNSLVDPSGKLATYTETAGENSAYQSINWTGLLGTELSYKISSHYRFSLLPGMRYSFQSIVKPSVGSSINPLVWDIGFRLRYNFK